MKNYVVLSFLANEKAKIQIKIKTWFFITINFRPPKGCEFGQNYHAIFYKKNEQLEKFKSNVTRSWPCHIVNFKMFKDLFLNIKK